MKSYQFFLDAAQTPIIEECQRWEAENKIQRLWAGDASLWTNTDEAEWLGWLTVAKKQQQEIPKIQQLVMDIQNEKIQHVVVLGMGGSSLCPDLLAKTFAPVKNFPQLHVLDSTDPLQIKHLEDKLDLKKTLFIVSSKSGTTLEPNIYKDYFYNRLQTVLGQQEVGQHFVAITDPHTKLASLAQTQKFRAVFEGVPSIGGRYSALSNFGMVPAALMGLNITEFLQHAQAMANQCAAKVSPKENPGVLLGIILGVCAKLGRDKVTFVVSPGIQALGAWLEQLLAESTGKQGKGLIPIDEEPLSAPQFYGEDRLFVYIRLSDAPDHKQDQLIEALKSAQQAVVQISVADKMHLGSEFFRWEMATAVAGSLLGINAFNQPDVEGSKKLAAQIIKNYEKTQKIPAPQVLFATQDIQLAADEKNIADIKANLHTTPNLINCLKAHLQRIEPGDYVNLSAFIEMSADHIKVLQQIRTQIRDNKKVATCLGFGPRFLHSTGQDYKGGPNTGVFLQITANHPQDLPVPGAAYTFGLVIGAQAQADFEVLVERSRRVLRIHLNDVKTGLPQLAELIAQALKA